MVAVVADCRNTLVGNGWSISCLGCANGLKKHYSHISSSEGDLRSDWWLTMLTILQVC